MRGHSRLGYVHRQLLRGTVGFVADPADADQGDTITFQVQRTGGTDGIVTVQYATVDGTAEAGTHYTAASGTLTWANGESGIKSFNVVTTADTGEAGDLGFTAALTNPVGASLGDDEAAAVILGDVTADACAPIDAETAASEDVDIGVAAFSHEVDFDWAVGYRILNVEAEYTGDGVFGAFDYSLTINHLNIPPTGNHCAEVRLTATHNTNAWLYSELEINSDPVASNAANPVAIIPNMVSTTQTGRARFHVESGVLTFVPIPPVINIDSVFYAADGGDPNVGRLTRLGSMLGTVSVDWHTETAAGDAVLGVDYAAQSGTVTFLDGIDTAGLVLTALPGATPDRTFALIFDNLVDCAFSTGDATYGPVYVTIY